MEEIRVSDSFDNQMDMNLSTKKSITTSIKPKLISTIQKTHNLPLSSLETIKKVKSFEILKREDSTTLTTQTHINKQSGWENAQNLQKSIRKSIQMIKQTTVYEDTPINVIEMFQKAERLSGINHQNKKTIKFVQICDGEEFPLCIERTEWSYFSSFSGKGILVLPDGRKIKGTWAQGTPSGYMTVHYPNQSLYYGELNADLQKQNKGYVYFKNGQKLEAKFYMGRMYGGGRYYNRQGVVQRRREVHRGVLGSSKKA